jgi:transcriptional regulator with PAS, ATPase and Fis domain
MPKANDAQASDISVDLVEKSKFDALESASVELQKALDAQKVELQKAMETIAAFEAEKKQAVIKSKEAAVNAVVKDEKQAAVITKAALLIQDQAEFDGFVAVIKQMQEQVEKSALFQEQGATVESTEQIQESAVARILKAQYTK